MGRDSRGSGIGQVSQGGDWNIFEEERPNNDHGNGTQESEPGNGHDNGEGMDLDERTKWLKKDVSIMTR